jgi:3-phosphoshikimate 1-carboxyvinyltransferase
MRWTVRRPKSWLANSSVTVPGDKSISHRALMLSAIADGTSTIRNIASGADVLSTASCLVQLGIGVHGLADETDDTHPGGVVRVIGGMMRAPTKPLDAGNSGTTMRLLSGILAGQPFHSLITGDDSLRRRPMRRIAEPLVQMGATVSTVDGLPPVTIEGDGLRGIRFEPVVPSAQTKSCVLLAGLFADGETTVIESVRTRDHTERMLLGTGVRVDIDGLAITIRGGQRPALCDLSVPGDFSSAAFFLALGALTGRVTVRDVGANPTRTAFLDVLKRFGAEVWITREREEGGEIVADVTVSSRELRGIELGPEDAPLLLDEMPLVALLGCVAIGRTVITGARELRVKESDRISSTTTVLRTMGGDIRELPDGFDISGGALHGEACDTCGDHRIAMMLAIAGSVAQGETVIEGAECASISFPDFAFTMQRIGADIAVT